MRAKGKVINMRTGREVGAEEFALEVVPVDDDQFGQVVLLKSLQEGQCFKVIPKGSPCANPCANCLSVSPCNRDNVYQVVERSRRIHEGEKPSVLVLLVRPIPIATMLGYHEMCPNTNAMVVDLK